MFDDPKKSLKRLEEELWAAEYEDLEAEEELSFEGSYGFADAQYLEDADDLLEELLGEEPEEEPPVRNFANGYGRKGRNDAVNFHRTVYADEEMDEKSALFVEKKKKKKGWCLPYLILIQLAAIGGVIWWWYRWLR